MFSTFKRKIKNFILILKYPFLSPGYYKNRRYYWVYHTLLDGMPDAWIESFGEQMLKDFKKVLKKNKQLYKFRFADIKEKYGSLRLYSNFTSDEIDELVRYYEDLSISICCRCGKPSKYCTFAWIQYLCDECGHKIIAKSYLQDSELTWNDIPVRYRYENGVKTRIDTKVDFKSIWKECEIKEDEEDGIC